MILTTVIIIFTNCDFFINVMIMTVNCVRGKWATMIAIKFRAHAKEVPAFIVTLIVVLGLLTAPALGAKTWKQVAKETNGHLSEAVEAYRDGKQDDAKKHIDAGYFGPYESEGMEATSRDYISAQRVFEVEDGFKQLKMAINASKSPAEVEGLADKIIAMIDEDAATLDGGGATGSSTSTPFLQSLLIIVREGFESILVISALVAYLVRSGNKDKVKVIYTGGAIAVGASVITAVFLQAILAGAAGGTLGILQGGAMLLAVVVLFWVSFWLTGKAEAQKWKEYIEGKVQDSIGRGNVFALVAAAFLAVYREGAETILFYSALISGSPTAIPQIAGGFAVGSLALVGIFIIFKYGSVKIPLKPFFLATSVLLYILAFSFAGKGLNYIQLVGLIGSTRVPGVPVIDLLGIYPTLETLSLQVVLVLAAAGGFAWQMMPSRKAPNRQRA